MAVSEKNTKKEIMDELKRIQAELNEERANKKTISQVQEEKIIETKKASAKSLIEKNILAPEIMSQYKDVMDTIELKKKELAEIQEMEQAIIDVEALMLAKEALLAKKEAATLEVVTNLEADANEKVEKAKLERDQILAEKSAKITELDNAYKERKAILDKEREREAEEYKYDLERSRKIENDKWLDQAAEREKELMAREAAVIMREQTVKIQETELDELKAIADSLPEKIALARQEGKEEGEKAAGKTYAFEKNAIKKDAEFQAQLKDNEIASLKKALEASEAKVTSLESKLEAAYANMNELAKTTVTSTGGVNVISTGSEKTK